MNKLEHTHNIQINIIPLCLQMETFLIHLILFRILTHIIFQSQFPATET